jgi:hypothetical protein
MDNITMTEEVSQENLTKQYDAPQESAQKEVRLVDIAVSDENVALNLLVSFLNLAQKRGAFSIAESSKIYECIQKFIVPPPQPPSDEFL